MHQFSVCIIIDSTSFTIIFLKTFLYITLKFEIFRPLHVHKYIIIIYSVIIAIVEQLSKFQGHDFSTQSVTFSYDIDFVRQRFAASFI